MLYTYVFLVSFCLVIIYMMEKHNLFSTEEFFHVVYWDDNSETWERTEISFRDNEDLSAVERVKKYSKSISNDFYIFQK